MRDTQYSAHAIFAVAIGMAMGANPNCPLRALAVVGSAALLLRKRSIKLPAPTDEQLPYAVRLAFGHAKGAKVPAGAEKWLD